MGKNEERTEEYMSNLELPRTSCDVMRCTREEERHLALTLAANSFSLSGFSPVFLCSIFLSQGQGDG